VERKAELAKLSKPQLIRRVIALEGIMAAVNDHITELLEKRREEFEAAGDVEAGQEAD
jgi:hypothetical protein